MKFPDHLENEYQDSIRKETGYPNEDMAAFMMVAKFIGFLLIAIFIVLKFLPI